eukprot:scaffold76358_cov41-Attheya_sp.AAC.1
MDVFWDGTCDIRLAAPFVGSFGVKEIKFSGRMSILLKPLTNQLPIVSVIQYAFINPPTLDLEFTGLAQIVDFHLIRNMVGVILQSMVVLPNCMMYKMDLTSSFLDTYQPPIGISHITALRGRGFQIEKIFIGVDDIPDVYCDIQLDPTKWRTSTIKNNLSPKWKEAYNITYIMGFDQQLGVSILSLLETEVYGKQTEFTLCFKDFTSHLCHHCELNAIEDPSQMKTRVYQD